LNVLDLQDYVEGGSASGKLRWSVNSLNGALRLRIGSTGRLSIIRSSLPGVFAALVSVSDGVRQAEQIVRIKASHFIFNQFYQNPPIVLSASESYRSKKSLYDSLIPADFPREQIRFQIGEPLPQGVKEARIDEEGRLRLLANAPPPSGPAPLRVYAFYRSPTPTPLTPAPTPSLLPVFSPTPTPTLASPDIVLQSCGGKISFVLIRSEAAGREPVELCARDINRDGLPDYLLANYGSDAATLLISGKAGEFSRFELDGGEGCLNGAMMDLNQDGRDEIVLLSVFDSTLRLYTLNDANQPMLASRIVLPGGIPLPYEQLHGSRLRLLVGGHFRQAGVENLAVASRTELALYGVERDGHWRRGERLPTCFDPLQLAAIDCDGDGVDELAATHNRPEGITIYSRQGDRLTELAAVNFSQEFAGNSPLALCVEDFDNDGRQDAAVLTLNKEIHFLFGGANGFRTSFFAYQRPIAANDMAAADFDNDGKMELLAAGWDVQTERPALMEICGDAAGKFDHLYINPIPASYSIQQNFSIAAVDANRDGRMDIALADKDRGLLLIYLNRKLE